ncbi:MAG: 50S ribosomal protein L21, partial [Acidobacteria bacterium]
LEGARVVGTIVAHKRGEKVLVFKFKKRKMYRKLRGHRQSLSQVSISKIELSQKDKE